MPASYLMSWESKSRRWWKQYKGRRYVVSCRQLGAPETKEGSYQAANAWWQAQKAAIDAERPADPHASAIVELTRRRDWLARHGDQEERELYDAEIARVTELGEKDDPFPVGNLEGLERHRRISQLARDLAIWQDRFRWERPDSVPVEKTLGAMASRFLELSASSVSGGELSASEYDLAYRCVGHFVEWIGPANDPSAITPDRWEAYFLSLRSKITSRSRSREYVKKDWRYAKLFIEWLASIDKLAAPKNLHGRRYKFGETRTAIETFTPDEVRLLVEGATGQLKLHLVLMLNCGFYQSDISDLRHDEVDRDHGTITRQRSKTRRHGDKVPTVSYKLWSCTLELMNKHRSQHPALVLTMLSGKPWVEANIQGNRVKSRRDGIKSNLVHLQKRLGVTKPLKSFRKTSSSMLDGHGEFSRYAQFFLGHSGRTVAERHYVKPNQGQFDRAVDWLRRQYGF
jgi:integrase